ncbi:PREDICTED: C-type lectin domain family 4 member C-like [Propithecus coquereli]|uniref:C-type lectin domain family 4 member C-like n=1 Tax=Propithecus coquereli TaxID=379532 RepID=UPI00063F6FA5|nr:PREDICTED: C-type lectin domain family 4 member C-like [Propithecus coquereli]
MLILEDWSCCPTLWSSFQSSCYFISTVRQSWAEHWKNCSMMGADLAVISTKDEQVLSNKQRGEGLVYGCDIHLTPQCLFHCEFCGFWHSGEPNNPSERCAIVNFRHPSRKWGWNDVYCHEAEKSICEMMKIHL